MLKLKSILKDLGRTEKFEVKNTSLVLLLIVPALFIFSYYIKNYGDETVKIKGAREFFAFLFFLAGILPFFLKKTIHKYYGWLIFIVMLSFSHYLIINLYINDFILRFILGFYAFVFGSILLFNNRVFINVFMVTTFIHLVIKLNMADIEGIVYNSILSSFTIIFIFSSIILNGSTKFRRDISHLNKDLEKVVEERTSDILQKTKDLEEKNKDLEEFAFVVSHDLKRPLRNISTLSSWLEEDIRNKNNKLSNKHLSLIKTQLTQMELIINGVLNFSLQNELSSNNETVNLNSLVNDIKQLNENDKCIITIKKKLPTIKINKSQILQVFQNLVQNGIKYNDKDVCRIEIDYTQYKNYYTFSVQDNGIGIEEKYFDKIFELFQKLEVNPNLDSVGIGLALVKKIIKRNNGEIHLKSEINKGTTFYFKLPIQTS